MAQLSLGSSPIYKAKFARSTIFDPKLKFLEIEQTQLGFWNSSKKDIFLRLQTSMVPSGLNPRDKRVFILVYVIHRANYCFILLQNIHIIFF
ncbi:hypothetical protein HanXRQr2_Chr09g0377281 [Helianthus annuus]|uniref:Uncharacterized protein n=1 Tax=Helianthus annuus TaxID=4232 RepID=A0A9K3I539_HELAN|nr:hypothetical protein HanXRQr2_Chr09g0377281 [Helianthus annuus]KAJ0892250.1 hypothetical protein HanPSC8_Chr09g0363701 [Helianthus annuus]